MKTRGLRTAQAVMVANATTEISVDSSCLGQDCGIALNHYYKNADTLYPAR